VNVESIKELLDKVPVTLMLVVYLGYLGSDYYGYMHNAESPLTIKRKEVDDLKAENVKLQGKIKEAEVFLKSLETKKLELRRLAGELDSMKGTLSESLDQAAFMASARLEAKRVGLTVKDLRSGASVQKEYYVEQIFELDFQGVYVQLMLFLEHMANLQRIVRVDTFDIRPASSSVARYVEITGRVQIKAYHYVASKADKLGREEQPSATPAKGVVPADAKRARGDG
jgi:Tfp pilus assembly protein PilO